RECASGGRRPDAAAKSFGLCDTARRAPYPDPACLLRRIVASPCCGSHPLLCANLAIGSTNPPTRSFPMAAAKKSSSRGGRKRSRPKSSGRKSGRRKVAGRKGSSARKSSARKSPRRKSAARKSTSRKKSSRGRSRRRKQSPVARVKRVATGVVQQGAGRGERAVDTVTEFVQD